MKRKEAEKKVKELDKELNATLNRITELCDEYGLTFDLNVAWGMGGTYYPNPSMAKNWEEAAREFLDLEINEDSGEYEHPHGFHQYGAEDDEGFWYSSSMGC